MQKRLIIGTRGSALALAQSEIVSALLHSAHPKLQIEIKVIQTTGDTNQSPIPLDTVGKGWFTKEIEQALLEKDIDLAVHSLKDLAEELPHGLVLAAYPAREDARDVLVTKQGESLEKLKPNAIIGTDSLRRQVQLLALRSDLRVESIRGNVPTRIEKMKAGHYDAIIIAAAGLHRLNRADEITRYFEYEEMTPAPGQGILAVEARSDDDTILKLLEKINDRDVQTAAQIERSFSHTMGGGCKAPVGAYATKMNTGWRLIGMAAQGDHTTILRETTTLPLEVPTNPGAGLAKSMLAKQKTHGST